MKQLEPPDDGTTRFHSLGEAIDGGDAAREKLLTAAREFLQQIARNELDTDLRIRVGESDIVQDTLLAVDRGLDQFRGQTDQEFEAWLRRIFTNLLINQYRAYRQTAKRATDRERSIEGGMVQSQALVWPGASPSSVAIEREERVVLEMGLAALPESYQNVIRLRHEEQLTFAQIGERIDRSADAARMLWYRAFTQLTKQVADREMRK